MHLRPRDPRYFQEHSSAPVATSRAQHSTALTVRKSLHLEAQLRHLDCESHFSRPRPPLLLPPCQLLCAPCPVRSVPWSRTGHPRARGLHGRPAAPGSRPRCAPAPGASAAFSPPSPSSWLRVPPATSPGRCTWPWGVQRGQFLQRRSSQRELLPHWAPGAESAALPLVVSQESRKPPALAAPQRRGESSSTTDRANLHGLPTSCPSR
mmetsp:Transcript_16592/g.41036  ORF Transcript_16592/g.41036 Transcript_16592/m.41036 type:complete len:208 (+) Transcript_16592:909-1532(+)